MKLPDVNLLLYAIDEASPRFEQAGPWVQRLFGGTERMGGRARLRRLTTKPQVMAAPLAVEDALDVVDEWLARPNVVVVHPTDRHLAILRELLGPLGTGGNLTTDAHLAALSIEHGAQLCSSDADFSRFPGVRWHDPLRQS